jgi:glycerate dehydrogenase
MIPGSAKPKAVFLDALSLGPIDLSPLEEQADLTCWPSTQREERLERLAGAAIAITNKIPLDGALLRQLPQLRLICTASTGTDQVDQAACRELGITLHNAGRYSKASVVQVTWALILELACNLQKRRQQVADGSWQRSPVFALVEPEFDELAGKRLSVIGAGDIGSGVARVGEAFGMTVDPITSRSSPADLEAALRSAAHGDAAQQQAMLTPAYSSITAGLARDFAYIDGVGVRARL